MVQYGTKWSKMVHNAIINGSKFVQNGQKGSNKFHYGPIWSKFV